MLQKYTCIVFYFSSNAPLEACLYLCRTVRVEQPGSSSMKQSSTPHSQESLLSHHHKRLTLLLYFARYMNKHLVSGAQTIGNGGEAGTQTKSAASGRGGGVGPVYLQRWHRNDKAILLFLTNGSLQASGDRVTNILGVREMQS